MAAETQLRGIGYVGDHGEYPFFSSTPEPPARGMALSILSRAEFDRQTGQRMVEGISQELFEALLVRMKPVFEEWIEKGLIEVTPHGEFVFSRAGRPSGL